MTQEEGDSLRIVREARDGDTLAEEELFRRYVGRLTALARTRLSSKLAARFDPEDVVLSAFRSFFIGIKRDRFLLQRSGDLWKLLVAITLHKLKHRVRSHNSRKRAVDREAYAVLSEVANEEPRPEQVIAVSDELLDVMKCLNSDLREVLQMRLQDRASHEIAEQTGQSERSVRRKLTQIQNFLEKRLLDMRGDDT